jgi:hypothetical protein
MSDIRPDAFRCRVADPGRALVRLIHGSFPDEGSRCAAVAAEVFLRWQLGGPALSPAPPSALLVNCGSRASDPVWELMSSNRGLNQHVGDRTSALKKMRALLARHASPGSLSGPAGPGPMSEWRSALREGFASARVGGYAEMWQSGIGLLTGCSDDIVLRLDSPADQQRFRRDVHSRPERLILPSGPNERLQVVPKVAAVFGSLQTAEWDQTLITDILTQGLPVIFLPHAAGAGSLLLGKLDPLLTADNYVSPWEQQGGQIVPMINLSGTRGPDWLRAYEEILRTRSALLPAGYQYFLLRTVRELVDVCHRIAARVPPSELSHAEAFHLALDLLQMSMRSIVMGVESLVYHCWGIAEGGPPADMFRMLERLRNQKSPVPKPRGNRTSHPAMVIQRELMELLERQGLVTKIGDEVMAAPLDGFLDEIPRRTCLPNLALLTDPLHRRMKKRSAR